ncbi:MAG: isocitrate lyase/phosphoenolpyruvate mutase family protein [Chitinophagales bacterium]|nr:isocitrate lyase/phosphoenolpyruvate mutase family protein [Chitinophagales bacterium]
MENKLSQIEKSKAFHQLHHQKQPLILPNIWDPFGAIVLEKLGYPAVATSSAAIALANGYPDGEKLPFDDLLKILKRIVNVVKVPVSADIETAYATNHETLAENIKKLIDTGIAGINYEDSHHTQPDLLSIDEQCKNLEIIKEAISKSGVDVFTNARIDVYIKTQLSQGEKLAEALKRGLAYKNTGADGLYPIILSNKRHIETIIKETQLPINLTFTSHLPDMRTLKEIGVARLSLATGYFKNTVLSMHDTAQKLLQVEDSYRADFPLISPDFMKDIVK